MKNYKALTFAILGMAHFVLAYFYYTFLIGIDIGSWDLNLIIGFGPNPIQYLPQYLIVFSWVYLVPIFYFYGENEFQNNIFTYLLMGTIIILILLKCVIQIPYMFVPEFYLNLLIWVLFLIIIFLYFKNKHYAKKTSTQ